MHFEILGGYSMHAYLIMAHNEFELLKKLIITLDYENNDLFIHVDKKVNDFDFDSIKRLVKKSNIYILQNRVDVYWGGYSQIQGELNLLKAAVKKKEYDYLHLLSGVDFPIKRNSYIHQFFSENKGKEFISFDIKNQDSKETLDRVRYYYLLQDRIGRNSLVLRKIQTAMVILQKILGLNRLKKLHGEFQIK